MMISKKKIHITVVGTDTNVGKTVVSLILMKYLLREGYQPQYLKPIQTGCKTPNDSDSDARFIYQHMPHLKEGNPQDSVIYCFQPAKAPWFAARNMNMNIDVEYLYQKIQSKLQDKTTMIIESAGGLMVPVTDKMLYIELLSRLNTIPILVARAGLGTINHTLLSIAALQKANVVPSGIIFTNPLSIPHEMVLENVEAIAHFSGIRIMGILNKIDHFDTVSDQCLDIFRYIFQPKNATN